jgi:hypothetical protein
MWANFQRAGADRLILARVLEARSLLRHVVEALPGAKVTVVRPRAPLAVLQARIRSREAVTDPSWFLGAATHTAKVLEQAGVEDYLVDNEDRPVAAVAEEVLRLVGWLGSSAGADRGCRPRTTGTARRAPSSTIRGGQSLPCRPPVADGTARRSLRPTWRNATPYRGFQKPTPTERSLIELTKITHGRRQRLGSSSSVGGMVTPKPGPLVRGSPSCWYLAWPIAFSRAASARA